MPYGITTEVVAVGVSALLFGIAATSLYYRRVALRIDDEANELERQALNELDDSAEKEKKNTLQKFRQAIDQQQNTIEELKNLAEKAQNGVENANSESDEEALKEVEDAANEARREAKRVLDGYENDLKLLVDSTTVESDSTGYGVEMPPPDVGRSIIDIFKVWLHVRKGAKMAKRGYLKWYRVGSRLESPKWIKPEHKGAGEYEYEDPDTEQTYFFPEEALVTDAQTSAYVAIHKVGEAEPIDLRDPGWPTMDADRVQTVLDMVISRDPPGGLSGLPLTRRQLYYVGMAIAGIGIWAVMQMGVLG